MGKYVWSCGLCLHKTKRKSNVIRHIRLVHRIGSDIFENNDTTDRKNDVLGPTGEHTKFCCSGCSYNTMKKYNLMRHLKCIHLPKDRIQQEEERHYNRKEFEKMMNRLKASIQSTSEDDPKMVKITHMGSEETEAKIQEGYLKALEILTRWFQTFTRNILSSNYVF